VGVFATFCVSNTLVGMDPDPPDPESRAVHVRVYWRRVTAVAA
jgi:hypothetical protein